MVKHALHRIARFDVASEFEAIETAEAGENADYMFRISLVAVAAVVLWAATGAVVMIAWGAGFALLSLANVAFITRVRRPVRRTTYAAALGLNIMIAVWFISMVIYIASWGGLVPLFVAVCGIAGLALHALMNHKRWSHIAVVDATAVVVTSVWVTFFVFQQTETMAQQVLVLGAAGCATAYFFHAFIDVMKMRTRLDTRNRAEAHAEKMAAVGQLSGGIAHDFNNILTVIRGNLDLIEVVDDPNDRAEFVAEARSGADRAAELVRQLLAYSGKSQWHQDLIAVDDLLDETLESLRQLIPANVTLERGRSVEGARVMADPQHLRTALMNASVNARDAMMPDGGVIRLEAAVEGPDVILRITDTGPGVPDHLIGRISEPFYSTKPAATGSGLGLSMIEGVAVQSGGWLDLRNHAEGGFCVAIHLPLFSGADPVEAKRAGVGSPTSAVPDIDDLDGISDQSP